MDNNCCTSIDALNINFCWKVKLKYFGEVIKHFRKKENLSMAELADGICTKDYIYLLEKGKRTPSIELINNLSAKLNFDWKEYIEYSDNPYPIKARNFSKKADYIIKTSNYSSALKLLSAIKDEPWAHHYPVCIEISTLKIAYGINADKTKILNYPDERKYFIEFNEQLIEHADYNIYPASCFRSMDIYAALLLKEEKIDYACELLNTLMKEAEIKVNIKRYLELYIDISLHYVSCLITSEKYIEAIALSKKIMALQENQKEYDKLPLTLIKLGEAYTQTSKLENAKKCFRKAAAVSKLIKNNNYHAISETELKNISNAQI